MKKIIVAMLILSVCILAACDNSSQPVVSGTGTGTETETPPVTPPADTSVVGNTVPDGAFFANTNSDLGNLEYSNIKVAGEAFPDTFQTGDVFLYNGYMYIYGFDVDGNSITDGWSVIVADDCYETLTAPAGFEFKDVSTFDNAGLICESINGKKIKSLNKIFTDCSALKNFADGFAVPAGVTDLYDMFEGCSSLETLPADFRIPAGVTDVGGMFRYCTNLASLPIGFSVPAGVPDVVCMFWGCTSLVSLPAGFTVPDSVTEMYSMFYECSSLETLPADFTIPAGVTDVVWMFYGCTSLVSLPAGFTVPDSVTEMYRMFSECTSLSGTITINANPPNYEYCFFNAGKDTTDGIELKGSSTILSDLAATKGANGKVTVAP